MSEASALFSLPCEFVAGAASEASLPPATLPEICFIGRSNVGKSSLVNALTGQKSLARISANPGMTKQLNFYNLGARLQLVDMPGYGYAKVSKTKKGEWDLLIRHYLLGRKTLRRACLLIDARRGPMPSDEEFMELLDDTAVVFNIVLTKTDAVKPKELTQLLQNMQKTIKSHVAAHPSLILTSSLEKKGIEDLQQSLAEFALPEK
ncbi:MAG: YihA family ribosome biogenesis GTP-binding protein [Proteobacteria bacterium]|nr:YihA family ribosome biogenesis GTP-binding protein [Pseudomonadota bacterium]